MGPSVALGSTSIAFHAYATQKLARQNLMPCVMRVREQVAILDDSDAMNYN